MTYNELSDQEKEDLEIYRIPNEYQHFLIETMENMRAGFDEGMQHLCSRFAVAFDEFNKRYGVKYHEQFNKR